MCILKYTNKKYYIMKIYFQKRNLNLKTLSLYDSIHITKLRFIENSISLTFFISLCCKTPGHEYRSSMYGHSTCSAFEWPIVICKQGLKNLKQNKNRPTVHESNGYDCVQYNITCSKYIILCVRDRISIQLETTKSYFHTYKIHANNHVTQRHYYHMYINTQRTQRGHYEVLGHFAFPWPLIVDNNYYLQMTNFQILKSSR